MNARDKLKKLDAEPFTDILTDLVECKPSKEKLKEWADSNPLSWSRATQIFAQLSGFSTKMEHQIDINAHISKISEMDYNSLMELTNSLSKEVMEGEVIGKEAEKLPFLQEPTQEHS